MNDKYQVRLYYGYEESTYGVSHAFDVVAPDVEVDEFAMQRNLAEQLDCTTEDIDQGRFDYNSMTINLPEELVAQIKADAVKEYLNSEKIKALKNEIKDCRHQWMEAKECEPELVPVIEKELVKLNKRLDELTADRSAESLAGEGYPREFADNTIGQILEQEAASCMGCGLKFSGFNVTDAEVAHIVEKMKETPQAFLDRDFIEVFCADTLCALRGLDPDKIRAMQGELSQLYDELQGAEMYDPGAADNIARVLSAKADELEAYVTGKSVADVLSGATARSAETGRADVVRDDFVKE